MRKFLDDQRVSCKPSTIGTYTCALRDFSSFLRSVFLTEIITPKHIASIDKKTLDLYLIYLHRQRLAPYSCVGKFLTVRKYLAWEVEHKIARRSLLHGFDRSRLPKLPDYLPRPLSKETDSLLVDKLRSSDDLYAKTFLLLRLTGLRISELINLQQDCLVTTARNEHFLKVPLGKMNNERLVPLCSEACGIIQKLKASRGIGRKPKNQRRLIGLRGSVPRIYYRLSVQFKKITAGMRDQNKPITFHRLRHTYATSLLSGGVSIVSIMKLLGHRRVEMSLRYAQITPTHLRNEYFRALASLELQYCPANTAISSQRPLYCAPADIIAQLAAFIKKESATGTSTQKNLARRLARLGKAIQQINIPNKFLIVPAINS